MARVSEGVSSSYFAPREVVSGPGSSASVGALLRRWQTGGDAVLVVRDAAVAALGIATRLIDGLVAEGFTPTTFDDITTEPTLEMARAVLERARSCGAVAVVGVGGGSCMDMAKLAATYAREPHAIEAIIEDSSLTSGAMPLVLIPTTAGTGAEASRVSMVSVNGAKRIVLSQYFVPLAAVLDPSLIMSLPPSVTASGGLDAISHAFEAYISTNATALTESASRAAIRMLATALPRAYAVGDDEAARAATLTGSHLAGWSLNAGVVLGHSIAYTIANRAHLPHGITTGMALPYALAYSLPVVKGRLEVVAADVSEQSRGSVDGLLHWLRELEGSLGAPTSLAEAGIGSDQLAAMATECVRDYPRPSNPVPLAQERLEVLLGHFHEGDLSGAITAMSL